MPIKKEVSKFLNSLKTPYKLIPYLKKKIRKKLYFTEEKFLENFFNKKEKKYIIQIGGNDGIQNDPLRKYFVKKNNYKAIIFEPLNYYFECLVKLYEGRDDIKIKKNGISNFNGIKELYFIKPAVADQMNGDGPMNNWAHGQGSFDKKIIEFHIEDNQFRGEKYKKDIRFYKENIESEEIKIIKLSDIYIPDNIETLLVIDVQGFELEVIESINFNNAPKYIFYEDDLKDKPKAEKIKSILKKNNYKYIGGDHDLIYKKM